MKRVAIIGAGVAGLSAAQELVDRGFAVDLYELDATPGGKARSFDIPTSEYPTSAGLRPLPAEHGFRFFPGFYRHLIDSMRTIPFPGKKSVAENLVVVDQLNYARFGKSIISVPVRSPRSVKEIIALLKKWLGRNGIHMPVRDFLRYGLRLFILFSSCTKRVNEEYERKPWWDFLQAERASERYRRYFANGSRVLVAADPRRASTKTNGMILEQLVMDQAAGTADRVLCGPTNQTWLFPWMLSLARHQHCRLFVNAKVTNILADKHSGEVTGFSLAHRQAKEHPFSEVVSGDNDNGPELIPRPLPTQPIKADYYVAAVPVEVMAGFLKNDGQWSAITEIDPTLKRLDELQEHLQWMNSVIFYLKDNAKPIAGHSIYVDTPFALSSVFQGMYWDSNYSLDRYGKGNLTGICSAIISNWLDAEDSQQPESCRIPNCGRGRIYGHSAKDTIATATNINEGRAKLIEEVWTDLKDSLIAEGEPILNDDNYEFAYIDPAIHENNGDIVNGEPLLVNRANGWRLRPTATTAVRNFFLAGDYVRTNTDLATMEAACEAAKAAVNGILEASKSNEKKCKIYRLQRLWYFAPLRFVDAIVYRVKRMFLSR